MTHSNFKGLIYIGRIQQLRQTCFVSYKVWLVENDPLLKPPCKRGRVRALQKMLSYTQVSNESEGDLEIGERLLCATHAARTHRRNIRQRLKIHTPSEAVRYALAFDLI